MCVYVGCEWRIRLTSGEENSQLRAKITQEEKCSCITEYWVTWLTVLSVTVSVSTCMEQLVSDCLPQAQESQWEYPKNSLTHVSSGSDDVVESISSYGLIYFCTPRCYVNENGVAQRQT